MARRHEFRMTRVFDAPKRLVPDERIAFTATIHEDLHVQTTVTFAEHAGRTTLSVHQIYSRETDATRGATAGWTQTLVQLADHLRERR